MHDPHPTRRTLLLGGLALLAGCDHQPRASFKGVDLADATYSGAFRLQDPQGRERTIADYRGRVVLLHFGFTQCPDACPTALARAAEIRHVMGNDGDLVQVLFVTLDPERDTPAMLKAYTAAFDPSFIPLWGDAQAIKATADNFKVFYRKVPTGSSYTMDHSLLSYAFDTRGQLRVALRHAMPAEDCAHDLRQLLA
ncbi:MAG TPA: SCO family protein [Ramlibacter sp.]|uniref:SCO family protein n=1 Tax=Ramlibacter sp. TaxID=1917967 RepID=UPI002D80C1D2|nr:SCO family protein [Ramlibacter sp.]HET8744394.1 SCO family protein [Ramlibacter sp.]